MTGTRKARALEEIERARAEKESILAEKEAEHVRKDRCPKY